MKVLKLAALLLGVALFTGIGATTLSAEMKCGAGKCGSSMGATKAKVCNSEETCKCDCHGKTGPNKSMKCGAAKCGDGKSPAKGKVCNSEAGCSCACHPKKEAKKAMKCGAGKCG